MRRFFSISTVLLTLFCIANIFFPLGSIAIIFSVFTLVFAFILFKLSKTAYKKNLPKVLMSVNLIVAIIFIVKPLIIKDEVVVETSVLEERAAQQKKAANELNALEAEGILDDLEELQEEQMEKRDTTVHKQEKPTNTKKQEEEIEFEQPAFN